MYHKQNYQCIQIVIISRRRRSSPAVNLEILA